MGLEEFVREQQTLERVAAARNQNATQVSFMISDQSLLLNQRA